jgi:hypothetical protein
MQKKPKRSRKETKKAQKKSYKGLGSIAIFNLEAAETIFAL